uniref:Uncharacterized protein n=1 Tax=Clandestinovirus TaxID=2831644 RepID=A0A8F8KLJ2_9VIRU|nr:hypothetical protein KOM_12_330 [Clandestinovirus]
MEHSYNTQPATIAYLPRYNEKAAIHRVKKSITPTESEMHAVQKLQVKSGALSRRKSRRISVSGSGDQTFVCGEDGPQSVPTFSHKRASMIVDVQSRSLSCITLSTEQLGLEHKLSSLTVDFRELFSSETWFRYAHPQQQTQTTVFTKGAQFFATTPNIVHHKLVQSDTDEIGLLMLVTFGHCTGTPNTVESKWIFIDGFQQKIAQQYSAASSGFIVANASEFNVTVLPKSLLLPRDAIAKHATMYHCSEDYLVYVECCGRELVICHLKDMSVFTAQLESTLNLTSIPTYSFSEFIGPQEARFKIGLATLQGRRDWVARLQLESGQLIVSPVINKTSFV